MKPFDLLAVALTLAGLSTSACAHGGEDHGDTPAIQAPPPGAAQAPRATAQTDTFELVAVLQPASAPTLTIYLDNSDSNTPVADASIEVESGAFKGTAKAIEPGIYTLPAQALAKPGHHPLSISVQSAQGADLLDASLNVPDAHEAASPQAAGWALRWPWLTGAALTLLMLCGAWWLKQRARAHHKDMP